LQLLKVVSPFLIVCGICSTTHNFK
jgi:hypothetical protein